MSAFVVAESTLETIVTGLIRSVTNGRDGHRTPVANLLTGTDLTADELLAPDSVEKLARSLHLMNVSALCQRYADEKADDYPMPDVVLGTCPDAVQLYKSLMCFLYQCGEGNVPQRPLWKQLRRVASNLAENIVSTLPEYDAARWG